MEDETGLCSSSKQPVHVTVHSGKGFTRMTAEAIIEARRKCSVNTMFVMIMKNWVTVMKNPQEKSKRTFLFTFGRVLDSNKYFTCVYGDFFAAQFGIESGLVV